jgi:hypothetical protein
MTELKLNHLVCHEQHLRFIKRDLRSKINLMEMDRAPLRYKEEKPTRIESIERLRWKINFGQNGLISSATHYTDDILPRRLFQASFNQSYIVFDAKSSSLNDPEFVATNSSRSQIGPQRTRELTMETEYQVYFEGPIETCLVQVQSVRYLSPLFVE